MRDIVLFLGMLFYLPVSLAAPAAGLAIWEWVSLMSPHRLVYGFTYGMRFNFVIAVVTLLGWLFSQERKRLTPDALPWVLLAFFAWSTLNMAAAPYPAFSWPYWDLLARSLVPVFLVFVLMSDKARVQGMVWIVVISLGFYGLKGGLFTILGGGQNHVFGPPDTQISDNNKLALALVMELPLIYYLSQHTQRRLLRLGLWAAFVIQVFSVFGSYSRGAIIAITVMAGLFWLRSKRKFLYAALGVVLIVSAVSLMPPKFIYRMNTLHNVDADSSFEGRLRSWHVALWYAEEHFPWGAGFNAPALGVIYRVYYPKASPLVAHSMYFEVLGDLGFPGLALYLLVLLLAFRNTQIVIRQTRDRADLAWAGDLARMLSVSMVSFCVGGAALSIAYYDGFLILLALTSNLREMTAPQRVAKVAEHRRIRWNAAREGLARAQLPIQPPRPAGSVRPRFGVAARRSRAARNRDFQDVS